MFHHLLREGTIRVGFEAPNREAALAELVALLPPEDLTAKQKGALLEGLLERERFGTTAVGEGLALPHCILPGISAPLAFLGISRKGIPFSSLDGNPVHLIFLVVIPEENQAREKKNQILHDASLFFRDSFWRERLKICATPEEAYEIVMREGSQYLSLAG